jgi:asparagine synthase (glutamine-hydrolysing)
MASGVEGRTPFLDHRLHECLRALPLDQKIRHGREKFALRGAMIDHLPAAILERPKHPFLAPPVALFADARAQSLVQDRLRSASMAAVPLFDRASIRRFADEIHRGSPTRRAAAEPVLMTLLSASFVQSRLMETTS